MAAVRVVAHGHSGRRGHAGVPVVPVSRDLAFGPPQTVEVSEGTKSLIVTIDGYRAGRVTRVNGRVVAIDVDHVWHDTDDGFAGVALLVCQAVTT